MLLAAPATAETCDGIDNDGDGYIDEVEVSVCSGNIGTASTPGGNIPDRNDSSTPEFSHQMTVTESRPVLDVRVQVNVSHFNVSDLRVELVAPWGTFYSLINQRGGTGDNWEIVTLDQDAESPISAASPPANSQTFRPESNIRTCIEGQSPAGTWTLRVFDQVAGNNGDFEGWSLFFDVDTDADDDNFGACLRLRRRRCRHQPGRPRDHLRRHRQQLQRPGR